MVKKGSETSTHLEKNNLAYFFEPQSVAVIGPLKEGFFGSHPAIKNLLEGGFKGKIYPIDVSCGEVSGLKVHTSIKNISEKIDLALIIADRPTIPNLMIECAEKDVKALIIVSDGFAESKESCPVRPIPAYKAGLYGLTEDRQLSESNSKPPFIPVHRTGHSGNFSNEERSGLEKKLGDIRKQSGIRIIGPNTAGIINGENGLICCPYVIGHGKIKSGGIALCGQNRMIGPHTYPYADSHYGVSKICDLGNKGDVDESDILEYLENDPFTKVIAIHIENIKDGRRFSEIARRVTHKKPLLVLRSGRTNQGGTVSTHQTGSLSLDHQVFDAVCKQVGIIHLEKYGDLFDIPKFFAYQPLPKGNKLGIVGYTGMAAALAADEGTKYNLSLAKLTPETATKLNAISPGLFKTIIDLDPLTALTSNYMAAYPEILKFVLADDNVDCLLHILWANPTKESVQDYTRIYSRLLGICQKPIAIWIYGPRSPIIYDIAYSLEDLGFPVFSDLETAIKAIGLAYQYAIWRKREE